MKEYKLRAWELAALCALCVSLCVGTWAQGRQQDISSSLVRLHVIAASDESGEQELKLRVRDNVLEYLTPVLDKAGSPEEAQRIISEELPNIKALRVILGEGEGHNWWCVVFPPLCVSAAEQNRALDAMSEPERGLITEENGYELRFRIVELWGELMEILDK